ncbi:MAG: DNA translocase FtsK [Thermoguttaceae bacterium]|jgi:S-DNA-T family DNA segregation ATPase FtsK/SpoIIIE|nr:DNA translocase FtsK [Thermoguttaceae bacterium]
MLEERNLKLDLLALGLLALTLFLTAAILSHDVADPPSRTVYPPPSEIVNLCGRSGAWAAWLLFEAFGLGAYYLLASLAVLDALLLARRDIGQPVLRAIGWLASLVGVTALAGMALPHLSPGPVIGSGGYLGAAACGLLELHVAAVGAYIVAGSLLLAGLLVSTDYTLIRLVAWLVAGPLAGMAMIAGGVRTAVHALIAPARRPHKVAAARDDLPAEEPYGVGEEEGEEEEEEEGAFDVRIVRPRSEETPAETESEAEPEDNGQTDETAATPGSRARETIAAVLGMKKHGKSAAREQVLADIAAATGVDEEVADYELPGLDLLAPGEEFCFDEHEREVRRRARLLEKTFASFGFQVRVVEIQTGPVIAQFEVELEAGLRLAKITSLADDVAIALRVPSVRIVAPIPGKNTVGIEVPNTHRQMVRLREVIEEANGRIEKMRIPIFLGKDVAGNPMVFDLSTLPHLLIAGRTGTGKSVCLNSIIVSMLMTRRPDEVRMLMIDPKMVELSPYKQLPHLMHPVVTDMRKAEAILAWAVEKMEERYQLLARAGVRHIASYNQLGEEELMDRMQPADDEERRHIPLHLPYVVIVADEMADLMMTAAKEVEGHIIRLAQKSRAVGIHLVLATQKPTVDVITGLIKSNLPARISFQVASRTDSRVVLDEMGADKLLGNGDLLFLWPGTSTLIRGQGTYLSDDEISKVIGAVATTEPQYVKELVQLKPGHSDESDKPGFSSKDELYEAAIDLVVREGRGSVSLLQRGLGIGYGRAARLIDYMAEDGIVGPYNGSQAREVTLSFEDWQAMQSGGAPLPAGAAADRLPPAAPAPKMVKPKKNRNKIQIASPRPDPVELEEDILPDDEMQYEDDAEYEEEDYEDEDYEEEGDGDDEDEDYEEEGGGDDEDGDELGEEDEFEEDEYEDEEEEEEDERGGWTAEIA